MNSKHPMRAIGHALILSATDLSNFLSCRHRTALEMGEVQGKQKRPKWDDPLLEILFKRGLEHERKYVQFLESAGRRIVDLGEVKEPTVAIAQTLDAMRRVPLAGGRTRSLTLNWRARLEQARSCSLASTPNSSAPRRAAPQRPSMSSRRIATRRCTRSALTTTPPTFA